MSETIKSETISRRTAFSLLGLAAAATVLTVSNAEAQTQGMERRDERREGRGERRDERREGRGERRDERREGRDERRDKRRGKTPEETTGKAPAEKSNSAVPQQ